MVLVVLLCAAILDTAFNTWRRDGDGLKKRKAPWLYWVAMALTVTIAAPTEMDATRSGTVLVYGACMGAARLAYAPLDPSTAIIGIGWSAILAAVLLVVQSLARRLPCLSVVDVVSILCR